MQLVQRRQDVAVTRVLAVVIIVVCLVAAGVGAYEFIPSLSSPKISYPSTLTVTNSGGDKVNVTLPVHRIVSLDEGLDEIIAALGGLNLIVGRDSYATFPPAIANVPIVGSTSYAPDVEAILNLNPDLVVANDMIYSSGVLSQIEGAGIPVLIYNPDNISAVIPLVSTFGIILHNQTGANALIQWIKSTVNMVNTRIATLPSNTTRPTAYLGDDIYWTPDTNSSVDGELLTEAGGVNIIPGQSASYTSITPEFVVAQNPDFIFTYTYSTSTPNSSFYQTTLSGYTSQPVASQLTAYQDGHVYLYDFSLLEGIRYPIALLYFAQCLYPSLFTGINVTQVFDQMELQFVGVQPPGVYMYPS